ncbi:MAG: serine/threonine protein kinase [Planctomycetes bacterium]|nr:serine/threonine protein kinase [Planctomycetota bacterium]
MQGGDPRPAPAPDSTRSEELRELLAACIDRVAEGGLDAAQPILDAHPELAPVLRERLAKLQQAGLLDVAEDEPVRIPERLGGFRLLRKLGSGGMGVVYLAEQEALGRQVALKLVRPEQLYFPGARARFEREVDAIARLSDPGIVPIFTVGEDGGIPFFAMEHVVGATLADVIDAASARDPAALTGRDFAGFVAARCDVQPSDPLPETFGGNWVRTCCRIVTRMAWSVQHAHERGVVHRDLKPSNAMVTPNGRVLLFDFGLAAAEGMSRLTRSGGFVGTLHYMAPEQLRGERIDARTDVYALGVTLYEMLALRAPFQADSAEPLRHAILTERAPPLTRANASVPRDVDTICRKAFDRDPQRRYATASALAQDLEAFLDHRPVAARRAGPWLRLRRAARRHPTWTAVVSLLLASAVAVGILVASNAETRSASRAHLDRALRAIEHLLAQARDPRLASTPGLDTLRRAQLDEAVGLLDELGSSESGADVSELVVRGRLQAAEMHSMLGDVAAATHGIEAAEQMLARLESAGVHAESVEALVGSVALQRGLLARDAGRLDDARRAWEAGARRLEPLAAAGSTNLGVLRILSACLADLAILRRRDGDVDAASELMTRSLAIGDRIAELGGSADILIDQSRTRIELGNLLAQEGRSDEARARYARVVGDLERFAAQNPECRREVARARVALAKLAMAGGDVPTATATFDAALAGFGSLAAEFPARARYAWELSMTELEAATAAETAGDTERAERLLRSAHEHHAAILPRFPELRDAPGELGVIAGRLAWLMVRTAREELAGPLFQEAVDRIAGCPADDRYWDEQLGNACFSLGQHLLRADHPDRAAAELRRSIAALEDAAPASRTLRDALRLLVYALAVVDDADGAMAALRRFLEVAQPSRAEVARIGADVHLDERPDFRALLAGLRDG